MVSDRSTSSPVGSRRCSSLIGWGFWLGFVFVFCWGGGVGVVWGFGGVVFFLGVFFWGFFSLPDLHSRYPPPKPPPPPPPIPPDDDRD